MAHTEQFQFVEKVKHYFPDSFLQVKVIDCGSLDVNGSFKKLFRDSEYTGVDIHKGENVDIVSAIKDLPYSEEFDTVISGEMLEHDETWKESLQKMYDMCKKGGLIVITCAGEGREEHGTLRTTGTKKLWGTHPEYYRNLTPEDFQEVYNKEMFTEWYFEVNRLAKDTYFYGIKT